MLRLLVPLFYSRDWEVLNARLREYKVLGENNEHSTQKNAIHTVLVLGEDRRFYSHYGIDTKALLRVVLAGIRSGKWAGASTVTQQLVRVITGRYERTFARKIRELSLASRVDSGFSKQYQLNCYLHLAYFGWQMNGLDQACRRMNIRLPCSIEQASEIVARLKYPQPENATESLLKLIDRRTHYLCELARKSEL